MLDVTPYLGGIEELVVAQDRKRRAIAILTRVMAELRAGTADAGQRLMEALDQWPAQSSAGHWRDVLRYPDGARVVTAWQHNLVVNSFANLVAALCVGNGAGTGPNATYVGIQQMAVGTGLVSWDTGGTPAPNLTDTTLVTELARKVVTVQFVDGSGNVIAGPSPNILVTCTFNVGEANGALREWGLFGGNATATLGSGIMVDHVTTPVLQKPAGVNDFALTRLVTIIL